MLTSGRKRGGKAGTGLSGRTVNLTLDKLTAALEVAVAEGKTVRNVAKMVNHVKHEPTERATWSKAEVRRFLATAEKERLHAAWRLSLYGLRRGEVLGLRWEEDVDLDGKTITVNQTRVLVEYRVLVKPPKSKNGLRTLPMDDALVTALKALRVSQAREKLAAGEAYTDTGYVVVDELGEPVHPERYSDEFERVLKRAGVPRIVLHGARHTALSLMEKAKVPISIVSRWAGHYDIKFTYSQYVHASDEDLHEGTAALGKLYKAK
jgi:integrase